MLFLQDIIMQNSLCAYYFKIVILFVLAAIQMQYPDFKHVCLLVANLCSLLNRTNKLLCGVSYSYFLQK